MIECDILMLVDNSLTNDRRIFREMETLNSMGLRVEVLAIEDISLPKSEILYGCNVHRVIDQCIFNPFESKTFLKTTNWVLRTFSFKVIHAHDHTMLNLGSVIKSKKKETKLIYDSHELFHSWPLNLSNFDSKWLFIKSFIVRKLFVFREKRNQSMIDFLITVNESLAAVLKKHLNIKSEIIVLRNTPNFIESSLNNNILREKFNIDETKKILVFIGANIYSNTLNLEQVINEIKNKDDIAFVIISAFNKNSLEIRKTVENSKITNVFFHDIVPPDDIPLYLSSATAGLVPTWNKKDLSYWFALDNKLFEYIQAGIPILATQQPEYKNIIDTYQCGICINPEKKNAYLNGFQDIIKNKQYYKEGIITASKELNWEKESKKLISFYNQLVSK